jgi:hypothetical protein
VTTVWVLSLGEYSQERVVGVYTSVEKAIAAAPDGEDWYEWRPNDWTTERALGDSREPWNVRGPWVLDANESS